MISTLIQPKGDQLRVADVPGDPLAYVSPSRLKLFLTCRLRFFFEKVLGLKAPVSPALQVGKAVHSGLQYYHKAIWRGLDHGTDVVVRQYRAEFEMLEKEQPVDYEDAGERDKCIADGERVLVAYLDSAIAKSAPPAVGVEVSLQSADIGLPIPLVGIVDLVRAGNSPVEFKTAASTPDPALEVWQHQLQLTAYHLLLQDATGEKPAPGQLVFLVKTKTPKVIAWTGPEIKEAQIDRFRALVDVYVEGVNRAAFHPCVGMQCNWCAFKKQCSAWTGRNQSIAA